MTGEEADHEIQAARPEAATQHNFTPPISKKADPYTVEVMEQPTPALKGRLVLDPQWPQRAGLALSTFGAFCLTRAVVIAYQQLVWVTLKKRSFKLSTIDAIFNALDDPLGFLDLELISRATRLSILAIQLWLIPISVLLTPATLTPIARTENITITCNNIQSINMNLDVQVTPTLLAGENLGPQGLVYGRAMPSNNSIIFYEEPSMALE
ncbi:uncharacterized protein LY89DRAFT_742588 [Mollisia scopiformis]|uniref:Uncharacterized protein n=1 Tax=Mollisia scopiformis TaxID=149040 RepID=A0A132B6E0_MOLSC|nr:uncharacterized protein LY89DRAFT_742588 [Mollisia scopiformis]KUJ07823.1 hypothetical protein LY89DRAFT_742588 [Mollisia scopiformis]